MEYRRFTPRGRWGWIGAIAVALGIVGALVASRSWQTARLADHWRTKLAALPDDQAAKAIEHLNRLGPAGLPALVEAVGSQRAVVARAAQQALREQVDRLRTLPISQSSAQLARVAALLAEECHRYGPAARRFAAELAAQLLPHPLDRTQVDLAAYLASCEKILAAAQLVPQSSEPRIARQFDPSLEPTQGLDDSNVGDDVLGFTTLPGGGLPIKPLGVRRIPLDQAPSSDEPESSEAEPLLAEPGLLPEGSPPATIEARRPPRPFRRPAAARPLPSERIRAVDPQESDDLPRPIESNTPAQLPDDDPLALMRRLHAGPAEVRQAALTALRKQGHTPQEIELAHRLVHPDTEVRLRLVQSLPQTPGIDAVRWLKWLCRDEDVGVRLSALTLLATNSDPAVLQFVEQSARADAEPQLRQLAEKLAARRRER